MTCEAGKTGRDVPLGASRPAASTPRLESIHHADVPRKERIRHALELLDEQVKYVRALGSVAEPPSKKEEA